MNYWQNREKELVGFFRNFAGTEYLAIKNILESEKEMFKKARDYMLPPEIEMFEIDFDLKPTWKEELFEKMSNADSVEETVEIVEDELKKFVNDIRKDWKYLEMDIYLKDRGIE